MSNPTHEATTGGLKRNLTLLGVVSLGINGVIGQGIFLTPGKAAGLMGPSALVALLGEAAAGSHKVLLVHM